MQRVAIARALVTGARLLLADEPTGNLDSRNGEQVLRLLDEIRRERGVTLLLATHSAAAAAARADRVVAMRDGRIVVSGFALVFRALVTGPARRHPSRVAPAAVGVAIGVAAVAAIHHANRSVTASFRGRGRCGLGRSDFVVTGVAGVPVDALAPLAFLWKVGSLRAGGDGSGRPRRRPPRDVVQVLGVDWGGDGAVRDVRLVDAGAARRPGAALAATGRSSCPSPSPRATASFRDPSSRSSRAACGTAARSAGSSSCRAWRAPRAATSS